LIRITSLDLSNNPKTRRVYSLMFIVDIEEKKKKNINKINKELLLRKTIVTIVFQEQNMHYKFGGCFIYSLTMT
jgi:hypothetical protein